MSDRHGNGNAIEYFVDRHEREGAMRRRRISAIPGARLSYGELAERHPPRSPARCAPPASTRERRIGLLLLDTVDFPIAFWGAIRAGVVPVPINTLLTPRHRRLHPGRQPRRGAGDFGAAGRAAAAGAAQPRGAAPDHRRAAGRRRRPRRSTMRAQSVSPTSSPAAIRRRRPSVDAARRSGVLAVFVGLDRRAEGRAARPCQPARHRRHLWRAGAADPPGRRDVLGGEGVSRLWPRQFA